MQLSDHKANRKLQEVLDATKQHSSLAQVMGLFGERRLLDAWIQNWVGVVCKRERELGSLDEGVQKDCKIRLPESGVIHT